MLNLHLRAMKKPTLLLLILLLAPLTAPGQLLKPSPIQKDHQHAHQGPFSALAVPASGYTYGHTTFAIEADPAHPVKEITGGREWSPWQTLRETRGVQFQSRYRQAGGIGNLRLGPGKSEVQFRFINTAGQSRVASLRKVVFVTSTGETVAVDEQLRLPAKHLHQCPPHVLEGRLSDYRYVFRVY